MAVKARSSSGVRALPDGATAVSVPAGEVVREDLLMVENEGAGPGPGRGCGVFLQNLLMIRDAQPPDRLLEPEAELLRGTVVVALTAVKHRDGKERLAPGAKTASAGSPVESRRENSTVQTPSLHEPLALTSPMLPEGRPVR